MEVFKANPAAWLKGGPGKEAPGRPGWTTSAKPVVNQDNRQINLLLDPNRQGVLSALLKLLEPYPEARTAVAAALAGAAEPPTIEHQGEGPDTSAEPS
jgi:hypothetical protein